MCAATLCPLSLCVGCKGNDASWQGQPLVSSSYSANSFGSFRTILLVSSSSCWHDADDGFGAAKNMPSYIDHELSQDNQPLQVHDPHSSQYCGAYSIALKLNLRKADSQPK